MRRYWHLWWELLVLSWRRVPTLTAGVFLIEASTVGLTLGLALLLRATVDAAAEHRTTAAVVAAIAAALASTAIIVAERLHGLVAMFLVVGKIGPPIVERGIVEDIASIEGIEHMEYPSYLDRVSILRGSAWALVQGMWTVVRVGFIGVELGLGLWILGEIDWRLMLLPIFAAAPLWTDGRARRLMNTAQVESAEQFRLQRHLFELATDAGAAKELRTAQAGAELAARQKSAWDNAMVVRTAARIRGAAWNTLGWLLFSVGFTAAIGLIVSQSATGGTSIGDVALLVALSVTILQTVRNAVALTTRLFAAGNIIEPYLWLRDYVGEQRADRRHSEPVPGSLSSGVVIQGLTYTYPGVDRPAIDDVSVTIPAGSVVAVVGEYGSGKTTLVKLLNRFYRPDSGVVLVDGADLQDFDGAAWRTRTSAAFQDFGRYPHLSLAEAIGLGDIEHRNDPQRLTAAVRAAGAGSLADRLPAGLQTMLSRTFGGLDLSEGQWQKVALGRASMRPSPLLFSLDEPTASLDAPSEKEVYDAYMARARQLGSASGAVTVIVSHRFSTVAGADLILVLDRGRLVECGTHEELLELNGKYRELFGIQASGYRLSE
jgi:ABC-type multidrug transport system fused ATPase/permease subunit